MRHIPSGTYPIPYHSYRSVKSPIAGVIKLKSNAPSTIHCTKHTIPTIVSPITSTSNSQISRLHCPQCNQLSITLPTDGFDHYAVALQLSRPLALLFLNRAPRILESKFWFNRTSRIDKSTGHAIYHPERKYMYAKQDQTETLEHAHLPLTNAEWAERIFKNLPDSLVHGTCTLRCHCKACGSSIVLSMSSPDNPSNPSVNTSAIQHCPYCGSDSIVISNPHTTLDPFQELANIYSITPLLARSYYTVWTSQHPEIPTFALFMQKLPELMVIPTKRPNPIQGHKPQAKYSSTKKFKLVIKPMQ